MADYISTSINRNPLTWAFFTFPHSGVVTREGFLECIESKFPLCFYLVARESHKDGSPHLHALVKFITPVSKAKILSRLKDYYPLDNKRIDVGRIKKKSSPYSAHQYLLKEDTCPITYGPVPVRNDPCRTRFAKLARDRGFNSIEEWTESYETERKRTDVFDTEILQCIFNIEQYSSFYNIEIPWHDRELIRKFKLNWTTKYYTGLTIDAKDRNDKLHVQHFINRYKSSGFKLL